MDEFKQNSIDPSLFQIEDVADDNACFYRAVSNGLLYITLGDTADEIINNIDKRESKKIEYVYENALWGMFGDEQDIMAKYLQKKAYEWNIANKDSVIDKDIGFSVQDYIYNTHCIDIDEYKKRYFHFAGEIVHEKIHTGKKNKKGEIIYKEQEIGDRWGGYSEQLALSHDLQIPIIIYTSQKYDKKNKKIITGKIRNNKPEREVRFKEYQSTGLEYVNKSQPIYLLWKKTNGNGHYMALYKK